MRKFSLEIDYDIISQHEEVLPEVVHANSGLPTRDEVPEGVFRGGRAFDIKKGTEIGIHAHVYDAKRGTDLGILLTLSRDETMAVYAEKHRIGKVKTPLDMDRTSSRKLVKLGEMVIDLMGDCPPDSLRAPSEHARLIYKV